MSENKYLEMRDISFRIVDGEVNPDQSLVKSLICDLCHVAAFHEKIYNESKTLVRLLFNRRSTNA